MGLSLFLSIGSGSFLYRYLFNLIIKSKSQFNHVVNDSKEVFVTEGGFMSG